MANTYTSTLQINCPANEVFAFVTDVRNMPQYLPTTHHAEMQSPERVRVTGEAGGHEYDSDGWLKKDADAMSMMWGSDGEHDYSGALHVNAMGDKCEAKVELKFAPSPELDSALKEQTGSRDKTIQTGLDASLQSIKNICEGTGGKVEVPADH